MKGNGLVEMVKLWLGPIQPFSEGVTMTVPITQGVGSESAIKLISPVPLASKPIAVFEFVQLNVGFGVPENNTANTVPPQAVWFDGGVMVGVGLTVMI